MFFKKPYRTRVSSFFICGRSFQSVGTDRQNAQLPKDFSYTVQSYEAKIYIVHGAVYVEFIAAPGH